MPRAWNKKKNTNTNCESGRTAGMSEKRDSQKIWSKICDELVHVLTDLGFESSLGQAIARQLGSPKAMERMISYLYYVKPKKEELVVDEMLAICSDIAAWREKKASERANAAYNDLLNYGLDTDEDL